MAPEVPARPIGATAGAEAGGQAEATPSPTMVFFRGDQLRTVAQYRTTVRTAKAQKAADSHSSALARALHDFADCRIAAMRSLTLSAHRIVMVSLLAMAEGLEKTISSTGEDCGFYFLSRFASFRV